MHLPTFLAAAGAAALAFSPLAAKAPPSPEQRIDRLEKQVRQVQRTLYPKGQPADTAGFSDAPAATAESVDAINRRLDALESQVAALVRMGEENANRVSVAESELARVRADNDRRLRALESGAATAGSTDQPQDDFVPVGGGSADPAPVEAPRAEATPVRSGPPPRPGPKYEDKTVAAVPTVPKASATPNDPAEAAYDAGYQLWKAGQYAKAIPVLQKAGKDYPSHRRASWAYNLAGRAMLDKGDYNDAAAALLANYRRDPQGERAQDSVFYLGVALTKLEQRDTACKAFDELRDVYGASLRADLKTQLPAARKAARCK